jgi:hypothetical protein
VTTPDSHHEGATVMYEAAARRLAELSAGVEELWGMSFEEYAQLIVDDPDEAQRVSDRAIAKAKAREAPDKHGPAENGWCLCGRRAATCWEAP